MIVLLGLLTLHLILLSLTHFTAWPEMIFYPWLLSKGLLLYRDLLTQYPPGAFWILEGFFKISGYSIHALQIYAYFWILLGDVALYLISSRLWGKKLIAATVTLVFIFWQVLLYGNTLWFETIMLPFYFGFIYYVIKSGRGEGGRFAFMAGLFAVPLLFIKQTAAITVVLGFAYLVVIPLKNKLIYLRNYLLPIIFFVIVGIIYLLIEHTLTNFISWSLLTPLIFDSSFRVKPGLSDVLFILPAYIPLALLPAFWFFKFKYRSEVLLIALLSVSTYFFCSSRFMEFKIIPSAAFSILLLGYTLANIKKIKLNNLGKYFIFFVIAVMTIGQIRSGYKFTTGRVNTQWIFFGSDYQKLSKFIDYRIGKEPFFIFGNYDYLYLTQDSVPKVLPYLPLFPWNFKIPGVQEKIIESLKANQIKYVLYIPYQTDSRFYEKYYPEKLGEYIFTNYVTAENLPVGNGQFLINP